MYHILVIDDDEATAAFTKQCLEEIYRVTSVSSGEAALQVMRKSLPELILLDIGMPQMNGFEVIARLKSKPAYQNIPVIFFTASEADEEEKGLSLGAADFIRKPFSPQALRMRIAIHIQMFEQKSQLENYTKLLMSSNRELERRMEQKILSLTNLERAVTSIAADLIEGKDGYTGSHVARVAQSMKRFLTELYRRRMLSGTKKQDVEMIALFSKLHDIGKIGVAEKTLQKTTVLNMPEMLQLRLHTVFGSNYIEKAIQMTEENAYLRFAQQMARSHHEWWDGSGYPDNLSGEKIPFLARVIALCNVYDTLCYNRGGQLGRTHAEVMSIIKNSSGTQFDPKLAEVFVTLLPPRP